jgi:hypothetical protein
MLKTQGIKMGTNTTATSRKPWGRPNAGDTNVSALSSVKANAQPVASSSSPILLMLIFITITNIVHFR